MTLLHKHSYNLPKDYPCRHSWWSITKIPNYILVETKPFEPCHYHCRCFQMDREMHHLCSTEHFPSGREIRSWKEVKLPLNLRRRTSNLHAQDQRKWKEELIEENKVMGRHWSFHAIAKMIDCRPNPNLVLLLFLCKAPSLTLFQRVTKERQRMSPAGLVLIKNWFQASIDYPPHFQDSIYYKHTHS